MKPSLVVGLCLVYTLIDACSATAYEVDTHEDISQHALEESVLAKDPSVLVDGLGLKSMTAAGQKFPNTDGKQQTIRELFRYGANQEDKYHGTRFLHHFYDPINGDPLTDVTSAQINAASVRYGVPYLPLQNSPDWALEDTKYFGIYPDLENQRFSFRDARQYFFDALTGTGSYGGSKEERERLFGLMFQTLGHVVHHIQDMAQPQHVKNEQHPFAPQSLYEHYTNQGNVRPTLPFVGYDAVYSLDGDHTTFDALRKFWATEHGMGKGLAEFTNFNFVTSGHNFIGTLDQPQPNPVYPNPKPAFPTEIAIIDLPLTPHAGLDQAALDGKMYFIKALVADAYRPAENRYNNLASAFSLYDDDLKKWNLHVECPPGWIDNPSVTCTQQAIFTVNRFTMSAAHNFLIPRAVGYSAGLINYFFRGVGKINVVNTEGQYQIKNDGTETLNGYFTLYYDDADGQRYPVVPRSNDPLKAEGWITPSGGLAAGQTMTIPMFVPPSTPAPATPGEYILVFQGQMGQEGTDFFAVGNPPHPFAVAAKQVTIMPGFLLPTGRLRYESATAATGWRFVPESGLQYGNVDWRGVAGAVSWMGPPQRYLDEDDLPPLLSDLSPAIWSRGRLVATAPDLVLGAALQRDGTLVAIVRQATGDQSIEVLYRKPVAGEWEPLATLEMGYEYPRLWFFDAEGQHAVSVKHRYPPTYTRHLAHCEVAAGACTVEPVPADTVLEDTITSTYCARNNPYECTEVGQDIRHVIFHTIAADYRGTDLVTFDREYNGQGSYTNTWGPRYTGACLYRTFIAATHGQSTQDQFQQIYWVSATARTLRWQREVHVRVDHTIREQPLEEGCVVKVISNETDLMDDFYAFSQYLDLRSPDSSLLVLLPTQWHTQSRSTSQGPSFPPGRPIESQEFGYTLTAERHVEIRGGGLPTPVTFGTESASISLSSRMENSQIVSSQYTTTGPILDFDSGRLSQPGSFAVDAQGHFLVSFPHFNTFVSYPDGAGAAAGLATPVPVGVD